MAGCRGVCTHYRREAATPASRSVRLTERSATERARHAAYQPDDTRPPLAIVAKDG
jgi:hypothetical protein